MFETVLNTPLRQTSAFHQYWASCEELQNFLSQRLIWDKVFKIGLSKFFKSCLPQILLGAFLNTLSDSQPCQKQDGILITFYWQLNISHLHYYNHGTMLQPQHHYTSIEISLGFSKMSHYTTTENTNFKASDAVLLTCSQEKLF